MMERKIIIRESGFYPNEPENTSVLQTKGC